MYSFFSLECDIGTDECVQLCDTFLDSIGKFQELHKIAQSQTMMDDATIDRYQIIADSFFLFVD